jgi:DNA-binding response OmpR family regulator
MGELILIVDDEVSTLKLLGMALEREGYRIAAAQSAQQAAARIDAEVPALVILDVMMPGVSGIDLVQQLRSRPETTTLPIILLSAKGEVADRIAGLKAGADEYLVKPIDTTELMARVAALLERTRRLRADSGGRPTKVISFIGAKGGSGTTSVTLNVGLALIDGRTEVIAAELRNKAGSFSTLLGLKGAKGLEGLAETEARLISPAEVTRRLARHSSGLQVLCAPEKMGFERLGQPQAEAILLGLVGKADYLLVDLPSIPTPSVEAAVPRSQEVVLVVEPTRDSIDRAALMAAFLQGLAAGGSVQRTVMVTRSPIASPISVSEIEERLALPVAGAVPPAPDAFARAAALGRPILQIEPEGTVAQAIRQLASQLR